MPKTLAPFLSRFDTVIFDMDGVITSEQNYWDIAALTVYEMLNSKHYFGRGGIDAKTLSERTKSVRNEIFYGDRLITLLKERGVNSNWDLAYLVFCFLASGMKDSKEVYDRIGRERAYAFELYEQACELFASSHKLSREYCKRNGELWLTIQYVFQEWYLGSGRFEEMYKMKAKNPEKEGMCTREVPIVPLEDLKELLEALKRNGKRLGIGTGRPKFEIDLPLKIWNIEEFFDKNSCVNYTDVEEAEKRTGAKLIKPHPYMFLKALYGRDYPDEKILAGDYDKSKIERTLIVGDAGADIFAAKAMGASFAAVLTGISGQSAREYFISQKAEFILGSVLDFLAEAP